MYTVQNTDQCGCCTTGLAYTARRHTGYVGASHECVSRLHRHSKNRHYEDFPVRHRWLTEQSAVTSRIGLSATCSGRALQSHNPDLFNLSHPYCCCWTGWSNDGSGIVVSVDAFESGSGGRVGRYSPILDAHVCPQIGIGSMRRSG